jgi:hypothetical protein
VCSAFGIDRNGALAIDRSASRSFATRPALAAGSLTTLTVRGHANGPRPRAPVTFSADGRVLGTVLLDEVGMATLRTADLPADGAGIVVSYEGDDDHSPCGVTVPPSSQGVSGGDAVT